jgi:hypothetical protein
VIRYRRSCLRTPDNSQRLAQVEQCAGTGADALTGRCGEIWATRVFDEVAESHGGVIHLRPVRRSSAPMAYGPRSRTCGESGDGHNRRMFLRPSHLSNQRKAPRCSILSLLALSESLQRPCVGLCGGLPKHVRMGIRRRLADDIRERSWVRPAILQPMWLDPMRDLQRGCSWSHLGIR